MSGRRRAAPRSPASLPASAPTSRWRWRGRSIRARIALILTVPTALLVVAASFGVLTQLSASREASATAENVELVLTAQELVHSLQKERGLSVGFVGGAADYKPLIETQRRSSNAARGTLDRALAANPSAVAGRIRTAEAELGRLGAVRGAVDSGQTTKADVFAFYSAGIAALSEAMFPGDIGEGDRALRTGMAALRALSAGKEQAGRERATLNGVFASGSFSRAEYPLFNDIRAAKQAGFDEFRRLAAPAWADAFDAASSTPQASTMLALEQKAQNSPTAERLGVQPRTWWAAITAFIDDLHDVQVKVGAEISARAGTIKAESRTRLLAYAGGAVAVSLAALLLGLLTFRSIVRPLAALTGEAHDAAEKRLPEAVARIQGAEDPGAVVLERPGSGLAGRRDEFAEVARALDHLQETAVRLAVEQAVMRRNTAESLANLGRRNQNLVRRQLGFISALEKEEADPNQLANLFELDHLATRMRRNAESLLVLVGEHSPRKWSGTISVGDILRSALAEVEDYRRVVLRRVDDGLMRGASGAEVSHLLAELIENALMYSPPDQEVEVSARAIGGEYHIAIVDAGIGMGPEALAEANGRLRGERSFLVRPTRDLGHFVVGRLAVRLGVRVWLHDSPLNGVTARVVLPGSVMSVPETRPAEPAGPPAAARPLTRTAGRPEPDPGGGSVRTLAPPPPYAGETTANGLMKRPPRTPGGHRRAESAAPPVPPDPPVDRTPGEVSTMLTNFRSGYQRAADGSQRQERDTDPGREN
ncbi:sensor histidine kinase [Actinocorallia longicatena]|uniref:histidine kinase n=1 Tax=Actinocorallia longicatena TaxID=111803 RepID=A0ABP6QHL6_9ACTN